MILDDNIPDKPHIEYPCEWGYKIIGKDKVELEACIHEVLANRVFKYTHGNSSAKGIFHTLNAKCIVFSQNERDELFRCFGEHKAVKVVI
ncbi:MAG: DUF493 domain-containing protein [Sulfurovum sp.]|nr:MAG: DUF493 domain-containing protein [Sulfurovum sp.]